MRIKNNIFNSYLEQKYFDYIDHGKVLYDEDITFLTFDKWKVFYEADPDNWKFHNDTYNKTDYIYFPYYFYIKDGGNAYKLIKFPTKREYKKFYKFYRKNIEHNLDGRENQQEILELAQIIGEKSRIRVEETQKKLKEDYKDYYKIVERCNKNTNFSEFFPTTYTATSTLDQDNNTFVFNKVPYKVILNKGTKVYANISNNEDPLFIEKLNSFGYPYTISGMQTVIEERFYEGYTYCKLDGFPYDYWIRIADIKEKINLE